MRSQLTFFDDSRNRPPGAPSILEGLTYGRELIDLHEEQTLVTHIRELPFSEFEFHGFLGKRRVVSFGWRYDYSGARLQKAEDLPEFLRTLRARAAAFASLGPKDLQQALVTEYRPGAGIGWHRDKAVFGRVVGVSLLADCVLRFRRKKGEKWERVNLKAEPRSAYLLSGAARSEWEHSISHVDALRYAITFRELRG